MSSLETRLKMRAGMCAVSILLTFGRCPASSAPVPEGWLSRYFERQVTEIESACLADVRSLGDWESKQGEYRRQLLDMLGLWPLPQRTELKGVVTGRIDGEGFTVEKLHYQSMPGLYVTANLYFPNRLSEPAPAILYVCGHAQVKTNGVSCGNKTAYQHHGIWFARHGYVCLILDTLQLGEIEGLHHGTHREGMWWWNARGYSPAGVEAWNSIRALDYLESRPEVDRKRIGMTGRSGGGSYSWTTAAIDERVRVAAPVAGMTDLRNHVVDGCVEGHCDCMYFVNTYRWDFARNAALIAPRPLLLVNTDSDTIFPLDGVVRVHDQVRRIYGLCGTSTNLGLVIGPGPHRDTQDLQVPVLRWFNRHLHGRDPAISIAAEKLLDPMSLRVFGELPTDQINTKIHERFVPRFHGERKADVLAQVRRQCFGGWPESDGPLLPREVMRERRGDVELCAVDFESQPEIELRLFVAELRRGVRANSTRLEVLGTNEWSHWTEGVGRLFGAEFTGGLWGEGSLVGTNQDLETGIAGLKSELESSGSRLAWLAPRGVGLTQSKGDARAQVQIRRRYMLLGQTLAGMQVWDIRRAMTLLRRRQGSRPGTIWLMGSGEMGVNALYAALFGDGERALSLRDLPISHAVGPDYLNVLKFLDIPDALGLARGRMEVAVE